MPIASGFFEKIGQCNRWRSGGWCSDLTGTQKMVVHPQINDSVIPAASTRGMPAPVDLAAAPEVLLLEELSSVSLCGTSAFERKTMNILKKVYVTLRGVAQHPLNRDARARAVIDFCVAQVGSRLVPGDVCVPFPNQLHLLISPRMKGAAHFISPGLCEFEEMAFVMHFLRAGDLFVDVGANVGAYMLLAAGVPGTTGIAIEPSPKTFDYLQRNVRLNDLSSRVRTVNVAVGKTGGRIQLTDGLGTENYVCPQGANGRTVEVGVTTLDTLLRGANPVLLKIDVEGFETEVLAGAVETLAQPSLLALIVERAGNGSRYGYDEGALHQKIQEQSFVPYAYQVAERRLIRLPPDAQGNIIYVRDVAAVEERLKSSRPFVFKTATI